MLLLCIILDYINIGFGVYLFGFCYVACDLKQIINFFHDDAHECSSAVLYQCIYAVVRHSIHTTKLHTTNEISQMVPVITHIFPL